MTKYHFESRALPPISETQNYTKYEVLKEIEVQSGEIASWFNQSGGGTQYFTDLLIRDIDGNLIEATIKNLLENGYIHMVD
ncbi:TNT domain-containing protein [Lacrimispora sp.]|uniref:TNT domain-containing protein n=1 Tax=Lacrimispora sp. TaxID=2719234 RepID=UPI002899914D|nr:TNT domain-containing protein [Lacrimispora sp.]